MARLPSLRIELLANLAVLATAALLLAVLSAIAFSSLADSENAAAWLSALIVADVLTFVVFGSYIVRRLVLRPLDDVVAAAEAIARGDLGRRAPETASVEFARLASSLNRMTARLLEEQALVVRAEKMASVGRLAAGVAHEIGNPLGAISGFTHIARRRAPNGAVADALEGIDRESARIDRIVRGLLEYAKPRRVSPTAIHVNECAERVVAMLRDQGALRETEVVLALDPEVPALSGDRHEMDQVLVNLLLNAVDAMQGGGRVTIGTRALPLAAVHDQSARRAADERGLEVVRDESPRVRAWLNRRGDPARVLTVTVADSGPGVSPEDAERVFDPFYTTKPPGKGTGLGLAIVARVVDTLGGVVWVRRAREGGAAFMMLFPVSENLSSADDPRHSRPSVAGTAAVSAPGS
ncbi:MAG: sensor histidine kinase [Gemmatimonadaceae bacterium]